MADCNETLDELHRFLDRELDDATRTAVEAHLSGCGDCLSAFDFHAELRMVIAMKCQGDVLPPGLIMRLQACLGLDLDGRVGGSDLA
jgi:mycothiol system anti-sigma-R factor